MANFQGTGIQELLRFALDVIRLSGNESLSYFSRVKPHIKFDRELVTEAELHLNEFFQSRLRENFPEHKVYLASQENQNYTHDESRYLWIYDPLDGVANFQAGIPIWGTSLALLENFWPVLGIFYMPTTGDFFHAQASHKAFWGDRQIHVSEQETISDESLLLTYSRFHHHYTSIFPGKIRDLGCTSAHLCYVAMGSAEAALIAKGSYQGLAAARVIIEAAGGKIYKMNGSEFPLEEYLDGQSIDETLLVVSPDLYSQVRNYF